ncbi:MAG: universal stress protein [Streptosporangiaceae bacterium]
MPLTERMQWLRRELADADLTGLRIEMIIRHGVPARELRRVTAERVADAIVIGAAERFPHRFAGSVPGRLARHARCPAVVVPLGLLAEMLEQGSPPRRAAARTGPRAR